MPIVQSLVMASGLLLVSCGDPSGSDTEAFPAATPAPQLPATSLMGARPVGAEPAVKPVFVDPEARCPDVSSPTGGSIEDGLAESHRLEPMLGQVLAYGGEHSAEFGTYGLVWHDRSDASVLISLTGDLDAHRETLEGLVDHPDELIVCQAALSGDANRALQALLVDELAGRFVSIGQDFGSVTVVLPTTEERLATDLRERYGDIVSVTFGEPFQPA